MEAGGGQSGSRRHGSLLLYSSLVLNALLLAHHFLSPPQLGAAGVDGGGLSWALQAAREAEAVAATDCSGHGRVFLDGIIGEDGRPGCECNRCFGGPDCSLRTPNCTADADCADPMFLEPYWMRHAAGSAVVVPGWHRLSYFATDGQFQSVELEKHIRRLHRAVGNAIVDGKHVVFGTGSMKLINALVYALSQDGSTAASPPAGVVATAPYYPAYRRQTMMFDGREYKWEGTTARWVNVSRNASSSTFIEFVASPNNPDSLLRKPVLGGASSKAIVDHTYYWPHFTHIPAPADEDVMLFSASKLSGHAGSRFGWALIRDETVAKRANYYLQESSLGESRDTQLRMLRIIKVILANLRGKEDIFAFGHQVMRTRWRRLNAVMSKSRRISLQKIPSHQYCNYFNRTREPSPGVSTSTPRSKMCIRDSYNALLKANIITHSGVGSEASRRHTRVSLVKSQDDFDVLLERLTHLVHTEKLGTLHAPSSTSSA
ncbi:Alliin lyase [Dichanthelium oligosanthes]|uniref:Alliin lyase n=1 Tax=Dichanthelium oligosanthes TaxID=888268 RepID=A0A1E5V8L9_9POAL|nr:Alliin lyase [Dichanthelium oligosanthes]